MGERLRERAHGGSREPGRAARPAELTNEGLTGGMGAFIMLGTLFGLVALAYFLVLRFDPEMRRPPASGQDQ